MLSIFTDSSVYDNGFELYYKSERLHSSCVATVLGRGAPMFAKEGRSVLLMPMGAVGGRDGSK